MIEEAKFWKKCSICKKEIGGVQRLQRLDLQQERTGLVFCSVECWDAHLGMARHRDAWAEDRTAPSKP